MATLTEIMQLIGEGGSNALSIKIQGALLIAADGVRLNGSATAAQQKWAKAVFENPGQMAPAAYNAVVAANNTATLAQLEAATDAQVQTAVNAVITVLAS